MTPRGIRGAVWGLAYRARTDVLYTGAFDDVFKEGLGDVDVSEDEDTVYTVDLGTGDLELLIGERHGHTGVIVICFHLDDLIQIFADVDLNAPRLVQTVQQR